MAYADKGAGSNKLVSVLLVVLLHVALGFGLIIGLNYEAIKKEIVKTEVFDVEEEVPEEEPPPPPETDLPPPPPDVYVPPAVIKTPSKVVMKVTDKKQENNVTDCPSGQARNANNVCVAVDPNAGKEFCGKTGEWVQPGTCKKDPDPEFCKDGSPAPGNNKGACMQTCPAGSAKSRIPESDTCRAAGKSTPLKPKGQPGNWVPQSAYPRDALRDEIEGTVGFSLSVGADGKPTSCSVTSSSGNASLDAATCSNVMKRAKFEPKYEDGNPVPSTYSSRVRWEIPKK